MDGIQVERTVRRLVFYLNYREPQAVHFCFFLGIGRICRNEKAGASIETPAHSCRFAQSYSSWSCSPAELHYASDCGAKVQNPFGLTIEKTEKAILQFELLNTYYSKKSCKMSYTPKNCPRTAFSAVRGQFSFDRRSTVAHRAKVSFTFSSAASARLSGPVRCWSSRSCR